MHVSPPKNCLNDLVKLFKRDPVSYTHLEEFRKRRKRVYKIWTYMSAAMYFYGVCPDEQITAVYNLLEEDLLREAELHGIFQDVKDLRGEFVYADGLFMEATLVEDADYRQVLKSQEGVRPFIPNRQMRCV